jgi:hypothetical protein
MIANWEQFFDRQPILERIVQGISASGPASFAVVGAPLTGKSALLRHLASEQSPLRTALSDELTTNRGALPAIVLLDGAHFADTEELTATWELASESATRSPDERLTGATSPQAARSVLLLDNLDRLLAFSAIPNSVLAWLTMLAAKTSIVATTTQPLYDLIVTAPNTHWQILTPLFLGSIDQDAANQWLAVYTARWPELATSAENLFELAGRHPFLLQRLGDSLDEVQQMLAPGQPPAMDILPFIRLRLAEYGRPLFAALLNCIQQPPKPIDSVQLMLVLKELMCGAIPSNQMTREKLPALNWLINQAAVLYGANKGVLGYRLFSPLFADFLIGQFTASNVGASQQPVMAYHAENQSDLYEQLTKMEASLLRYLQNHSLAVVSVEQLLADVWKRPNASTRRVQEAIRRLRMQLERQSPPVGEIRNERGRGYRFVPYRNGRQISNQSD